MTSNAFLIFAGALARKPMDLTFACAARALTKSKKSHADASRGGPCEMDVFVILPATGHLLYQIANATAQMADELSLDELFAISVSRIRGMKVHMIDNEVPIVRSEKYWRYAVDESTPKAAFIEFDGKHHFLGVNKSECQVGIHVDYAFYNTLPIITKSMGHLISNDAGVNYLAGCISYFDYQYLQDHFNGSMTDDAVRSLGDAQQQRRIPRSQEHLESDPNKGRVRVTDIDGTVESHDSGSTATATASGLDNRHTRTPEEEKKEAKIIDGFLFYDEVGMLLLRLHALKSTVDHHIIIESNSTFTGKTKPLYFAENKELFAEFLPRITHIVIHQLPHPVPTEAGHVWANEYYSRDAVIMGLEGIGARDEDIVLIGDTDEIPHPNALQMLRAKFAFYGSLSADDPRSLPAGAQIYKLFVDNYIYSFDCFVGEKEAAGTPLSATTVGYARQLAKECANYRDYNWMYAARHHLHLEYPLPYENVIYPGGWHLSFFESVDRIKRKIESYGHQNFVRQFQQHGNSTDSSYQDDGDKVPKELPPNVEMAVEAIAARVAEGAHK
jgi:beta-1,4-mannosyl-glycoprotein beta-1,4-N-acetylglucosaminyltransferase